MTSKNKIKDLLSFSIVNIIASLIFSVFWLYLASIIPKTEYGELGFLISVANVGSAIAIMGFNSVVVVYESKKENVFPTSFLVVLISSNVTAAITFIFTQNTIVSILVVGVVFFNLILSGLNSNQKYNEFSKHKILRSIITVIIALIAYQYMGINGILLGYFLSTLLILKELYPLIKNKKIEFSILKPKIPFMLHAYARRLSDVFIRWGDKILIGSLFGFSILGSYYVAVQFLLLLATIPQSLSIYLIPKESTGEKNKNIKIFSIIISSFVAIISIFIIPFGINAFLPKYEESIIPMQILSLGIIPLTIGSIQESEFFGKENSQAVLYGSGLQSVFYLISIIFLGEVFGLLGFSLGFFLAVTIRVFFNVIISKISPKI